MNAAAHLFLFMKFRTPIASMMLVGLMALIPIVQAQSTPETYFAYILPPQTEVTINGEVQKNTNLKETALVFSNEEEDIVVGPDQEGVRIQSNRYTAAIKPESELTRSSVLQLNSGSISVVSNDGEDDETEMLLGELILRFRSAHFLAFRSLDGSQSIIKLIEGELKVENPTTEQSADLTAGQATSADEEGRLLIPFASEVDVSQGWWTTKAYLSEPAPLPIADSGPDQRILKNVPVTLDGSRSEYDTGDIFEWKLVDAPPGADGKPIEKVSLNIVNIVKPIFTPTVDGEYTFSLVITDKEGLSSNRSTVKVYVGKEYLEPVDIFPDVDQKHPNNLAITYLYKKNVMRGSQDPETGEILFRPDDTINRVEILKTVFENIGAKVPTKEELAAGEEIFADVKPDHWFAPYVAYAKDLGIVSGNDGLYRPADEVNLAEAIKIITEATNVSVEVYENNGESPYADALADVWYTPYLFFVKKHDLVDADSKGNIQPGKSLTRAEFAEIIYRLESRNSAQKKGFLSGAVLQAGVKKGIANAEVLMYKAVQADEGYKKGDLYEKVTSDATGQFTVTLPVMTMFIVEAVTEEDISNNRVIIQVKEDEVKSIELEIETQ